MVFGALFIYAHCFCQYNEGMVPHFLEELFVWSPAKSKENKTISDGGITVDFWFIKVHTN